VIDREDLAGLDGRPGGDDEGSVTDDHPHRVARSVTNQLDHFHGTIREFDHTDGVGLGGSRLHHHHQTQQHQASGDDGEEQQTPTGSSDVGPMLDTQGVGGETEFGRMAPDTFVLWLGRRR